MSCEEEDASDIVSIVNITPFAVVTIGRSGGRHINPFANVEPHLLNEIVPYATMISDRCAGTDMHLLDSTLPNN